MNQNKKLELYFLYIYVIQIYVISIQIYQSYFMDKNDIRKDGKVKAVRVQSSPKDKKIETTNDMRKSLYILPSRIEYQRSMSFKDLYKNDMFNIESPSNNNKQQENHNFRKPRRSIPNIDKTQSKQYISYYPLNSHKKLLTCPSQFEQEQQKSKQYKFQKPKISQYTKLTSMPILQTIKKQKQIKEQKKLKQIMQEAKKRIDMQLKTNGINKQIHLVTQDYILKNNQQDLKNHKIRENQLLLKAQIEKLATLKLSIQRQNNVIKKDTILTLQQNTNLKLQIATLKHINKEQSNKSKLQIEQLNKKIILFSNQLNRRQNIQKKFLTQSTNYKAQLQHKNDIIKKNQMKTIQYQKQNQNIKNRLIYLQTLNSQQSKKITQYESIILNLTQSKNDIQKELQTLKKNQIQRQKQFDIQLKKQTQKKQSQIKPNKNKKDKTTQNTKFNIDDLKEQQLGKLSQKLFKNTIFKNMLLDFVNVQKVQQNPQSFKKKYFQSSTIKKSNQKNGSIVQKTSFKQINPFRIEQSESQTKQDNQQFKIQPLKLANIQIIHSGTKPSPRSQRYYSKSKNPTH